MIATIRGLLPFSPVLSPDWLRDFLDYNDGEMKYLLYPSSLNFFPISRCHFVYRLPRCIFHLKEGMEIKAPYDRCVFSVCNI